MIIVTYIDGLGAPQRAESPLTPENVVEIIKRNPQWANVKAIEESTNEVIWPDKQSDKAA